MIVRALDTILLLHADHEQLFDLYVHGRKQWGKPICIGGGRVSALWGPLHGGANVAVVDMLDSMLMKDCR